MMIKEKNLTNAEKKRIESLDKRIEKIQNKIAINRKEYDAMTPGTESTRTRLVQR